MYPDAEMAKKSTPDSKSTPEKGVLRMYVLPELGVSVEATSVEDAVAKAEKLTENK